MNAPQIILLVLVCFGLGVKACLHGEEVRVNFWAALGDFFILLGLLYWGGFFG